MIKEKEIEIVGGIIFNFGVVKKDRNGADWTVLYQDPQDKRYWEFHYPEGELHGGGPPSLRVLI